MYNEIRRKITSLTLMTIMLAGSMVIAIPGDTQAAYAQAGQTNNLYVSSIAFGGPMVLEIIVDDPNLGETDEANGMPNVSIDGNDLVMAQGDDGSWYAYVADAKMVDAANAVTLLFGTTACTNAGDIFTTSGINRTAVYCNADIVKKPRSLNDNAAANGIDKSLGGIGLIDEVIIPDIPSDWPFIQAVEFTNDADIDVIYDGGQDEVIEITYTENMDEFASYSLDKTSYPHNADIHLLIDDMQLNIDPTDEDVWYFDTITDISYYGEVDVTKNEALVNELSTPDQNTLNYGDNGYLSVESGNPIVIVVEQYNDKSIVTVKETLPNSGLFENTNNANTADLITTSNSAIRGQSGIIEYNDESTSVLVNYFSGSVDMLEVSIDGAWSSGEPMDVTIVDQDANINTKLDNDFDVSKADSQTIPSIRIGEPITLGEETIITVNADTNIPLTTTTIELTIGAVLRDADLININGIVFEADDSGTVTSPNVDFVIGLNNNETAQNLANAINNNINVGVQATNDDTTNIIELVSNIPGGTILNPVEIPVIVDAVLNIDVVVIIVGANADTVTSPGISIDDADSNSIVDRFSSRITLDVPNTEAISAINMTYNKNISDLIDFVTGENIYAFFNYDISSLDLSSPEISISNGTDKYLIPIGGDDSGYILLNNDDIAEIALLTLDEEFNSNPKLTVMIKELGMSIDFGKYPIVMDFVRYGGDDGRINDAIYRLEAEETDKDSGTYTGTVEYTMLNQINLFDSKTFEGLKTIGDELEIIVHEDLTDEDAVSVIYLDTNAQGRQSQVSDQEDAPTYSGAISFDNTSYKVADTVTITLEDADLNTESDTIDIYTVIDEDVIALAGIKNSLLFDVTINDALWETCEDVVTGNTYDGLYGSMNTLIETTKDSGVFTGTFQMPSDYCTSINLDGEGIIESVTGKDIEVNYQDFRDASGEQIETGDSAGVRANTGSVSFDRTVYPVPFGVPSEGDSNFAVHATADIIKGNKIGYLQNGDLTIHVRVNDPDFDISANGEDKIAVNTDHGPVKVTISRGSETVLLATAGAERSNGGLITIGDKVFDGSDTDPVTGGPGPITRELGPITEIAPDAGVFELDLVIRYTDGPSSSTCPDTKESLRDRIDVNPQADYDHCILQGDIISVEYTDPTDASGSKNSVTDSATFDLRNGVLQTDKSVYIIGADMILTLIEPDFDLDDDSAETYDLDLIEWDSDAATTTMGDLGSDPAAFDPEPSALRETGDSTGIFQIVIEIPADLDGDNLERGEEIVLEYTDWGPSGANYVGDEDEDVNLTVFTSNFGATVELDQKVYTWTDKVYITIVAPDHNFDTNLVDEIGNTNNDSITVSTRNADIDNYKLVETGTDTGIFTGEVILTGFASHDADGDGEIGDASEALSLDNSGPTDGLLPADNDDGLTVSFEFSDGETTLGSSLIRWNIGETQWLEASYPASGTGVVRIIDPDMNLNPESVDNFDVDVWSDSDAGGISLTVTETNEATGIYEGTVFFTTTDESSGHRLRVAEGDTVTAEYEDNTLPDPYTTADELDITATTLIGTVVPPLERAPAANLRTVDAFGNSLSIVSVDQQVQISADLANGQDREQGFAYLVQIQDGNGVTVSLAWITGSLTEGQSFSPALSWIPTQVGSYTATAFVWESVDNPTALSPPVSTTITVS